MKLVILVIIYFLHIVDDYYLQGILAQLKQKQFWLDYCKQYEQEKQLWEFYKNDYKMALIAHAFSWAFVTSIPYLILSMLNEHYAFYFVQLVLNTVVHAFIDNLKCNKLELNLVQDQLLHLIQLTITYTFATAYL